MCTGRSGSAVLEGQDFRERVTRPDGSVDKDKFWQLWPDLRVLSRCNPTDKLIIVRGDLPLCVPRDAWLLRDLEATWTSNTGRRFGG